MESASKPTAVVDTGSETVRFTFTVNGQVLRGIASREFLEDEFGAGTEPSAWLAAYNQHADQIIQLATDRYDAEKVSPVLLHSTTRA